LTLIAGSHGPLAAFVGSPTRAVPPVPAGAVEGVARVRTRVPLPMNAGPSGAGRPAEVATFDGLPDRHEHIAVLFTGWRGAPLVRLHSECLTGDVFGSQRCDCGPQLNEAVSLMHDGGGIILYLRQEGRGIGLYNKLDAYRLQDAGLDTFAANRELSFSDDGRNYASAAHMLTALGVHEIKLLTNNPDKTRQMRSHGIAVSEVRPTGVFRTEANRRYLDAKRDLAGHTIEDLQFVP
jgi:GTP cyclohydrolase II